MKSKMLKTLGLAAGEMLIESAPDIVSHFTNKKEEKSFFEENKSWIFIIILAIFIIKLEYINMFESIALNSVVNIIFGITLFTLLCLFFYEERNVFKIKSWFIRILLVSLIILGVINSLYHIGYAIGNLLT